MGNLSERIQQARISNGLSRAELARRVCVKPSAAVQWEQKHGTTPSVSNLVKIASVTGVAFEWLATGRGTSRLIAPNDSPAVDMASFARNLYEERLLEIARILPPKSREPLMQFLEQIAPRQPQSPKS